MYSEKCNALCRKGLGCCMLNLWVHVHAICRKGLYHELWLKVHAIDVMHDMVYYKRNLSIKQLITRGGKMDGSNGYGL